jgi:hypothetical protein
MKYSVIAQPDGYAVAYPHASGGWVAHSMHCQRNTAETEAQALNEDHAAAVKAAQSSLQMHREHAFAERRPVRYFEPDAFA